LLRFTEGLIKKMRKAIRLIKFPTIDRHHAIWTSQEEDLMHRVYCFMTLVLAVGFLSLTGCESGDGGRVSVSGYVEYKGTPLQTGSIEFIPHPGVKTQSGAVITNGRFSIPADKGLEPGMYTVKISAMETTDVSVEPGGLPGKDPKELLPAKYNTKSTLTQEVKKGENKFEFKLD
jgi:hypothetical protein